MALASTKVRLGLPTHELLHGNVQTALTGAGSTSQANSAAITADVNIYTTVSAGHGCRLPNGTPGDEVFVVNGQATNALLLYPASGEKLNHLSADASISIPAAKSAVARCVSAGLWHVVVSA